MLWFSENAAILNYMEDVLMIDGIEGKWYYRQERMQQHWISDTGYFP